MKLKKIRAVHVNIPSIKSKTKPRRAHWNDYKPRAMPINYYSEFSRLPASMPAGDMSSVWVEAVAEDGTWGLGQCAFGKPVAAYIDEVYSPLLEGRDCMAIEYLNDLMVRSSQRHGIAGTASTAQSGIDLALWDLKGKLLEQPVYSLLGGPSRNDIELYATGDDLDWSAELGFRKFKITNPTHYIEGTEGLYRTVEHVAQARDQVGSYADLMINPVMSFNVEFTLRLAEELRPFKLRWLEEPLIPTDIQGHIELKKAITWIPLATGEDHHGRAAFRELIEKRAIDIVQPDIKWCGGLSEAWKVYTMAEAAGIATIPHGGCNDPFGQHFSLAAPESPMGEYWLAAPPGVPLEEVVKIPGTAVPVNGKIRPSDAPGFGMEIQKEWISDWH